jgi:hypothetical protein
MHKIAIPRRDAPESCKNPFAQKEEGAGNAGCALHPRSRVQVAQENAHTSIQVQRRHSGIPCAMVLRLMPRSPRRRIRLVTVIGGLEVLSRPVGLANLRRLDTSNGCQDHTVLPYAAARLRQKASPGFGAVVLRNRYRSRDKPALQFRFTPTPAASTASRPNVRDDGQRPSSRAGMGRASRADLPDGTSGIFSYGGLDRKF